jgi:hypothetical protein
VCVRTREDQPDVTVFGPLHEVRRRAIGTVHFEDLTIAGWCVSTVAPDDESISYACLHFLTSFDVYLDLRPIRVDRDR